MHTCNVSGKSYVGFTSKTMDERWAAHCSMAKRGSRCHFHLAISAYGEDAWTHEILHTEISTIDDAKRIEISEILSRKTFEPNIGYNMTFGGDMISKSDCVREKIRASHLGKRLSDEHKKNIGDGIRGLIRGKQSPEHRDKLRAARIGKTNRAKRVEKLDDSGVIATFASMKDAIASVNSTHVSRIRDCCRGASNEAFGFKWRWA